MCGGLSVYFLFLNAALYEKPGRRDDMSAEEKEKNIHAGHRKRLKQEFLSAGLDSFPEHRALELLLFYALPRGDANPTAHALLDAFGSLSDVLDADYQDLVRIPGISDHTAVLLKLIPAISGKYLASRLRDSLILRDSHDLWELFSPHFFGARNEMSWLACFDAKRKLLGVRKLSEGSPTATDIGVRRVVSAALSCNATLVVLAHNHPSGIASPSDEDVSTTLYLRKLLRPMDIDLYDHVILVDDDMVSMRDSGYFIPI